MTVSTLMFVFKHVNDFVGIVTCVEFPIKKDKSFMFECTLIVIILMYVPNIIVTNLF